MTAAAIPPKTRPSPAPWTCALLTTGSIHPSRTLVLARERKWTRARARAPQPAPAFPRGNGGLRGWARGIRHHLRRWHAACFQTVPARSSSRTLRGVPRGFAPCGLWGAQRLAEEVAQRQAATGPWEQERSCQSTSCTPARCVQPNDRRRARLPLGLRRLVISLRRAGRCCCATNPSEVALGSCAIDLVPVPWGSTTRGWGRRHVCVPRAVVHLVVGHKLLVSRIRVVRRCRIAAVRELVAHSDDGLLTSGPSRAFLPAEVAEVFVSKGTADKWTSNDQKVKSHSSTARRNRLRWGGVRRNRKRGALHQKHGQRGRAGAQRCAEPEH